MNKYALVGGLGGTAFGVAVLWALGAPALSILSGAVGGLFCALLAASVLAGR